MLHPASRRSFLRLALAASLPLPVTASRAAAEPAAGIDTLADLLPQARWNPKLVGPLLLVGANLAPRLRRRKEDPPEAPPLPTLPPPAIDGTWDLRQALPAFARRAYPMGSLTVIAPLEMSQLADTPPTKEPNFWAGASRYKRIEYLLSTLNSGQWQRLGSSAGLGVNDLASREQQEVFLSLLPDPMVITTTTVTAKGFPDYDRTTSRTLSAAERKAVRLHAQRSVRYEIQDRASGGSVLSGDDYYGEPGETWTDWKDDETYSDANDHAKQAASVYGIPVVTLQRNTPKPSDIDYTASALKKPISLQPSETIATLAARIGTALDWELIPDIRVASLPVVARGEQAMAGDLLQAIAFTLCSAWRHVDEKTYVLTADQTGAGTRRLRLAIWQAELDRQAQTIENEWMRTIAKSGGVKSALRYDVADPLTPLDDIIQKAEKLSGTGDANLPENMTPVAKLPPGARLSIQRQIASLNRNKDANPGDWDPDRVHVEPAVRARFLLPDGTSLPANIDLGEAWPLVASQEDDKPFDATAQLSDMLKDAKAPYPLPGGMRQRILFLSASTREDAISAVTEARRCGFETLYLATDDTAFLSAAITEGRKSPPVRVGAVVMAFPPQSKSQMDRNLLGETPSEAEKARNASPLWARYLENLWPNFPFPFTRSLIGRCDPSFAPLPQKAIEDRVQFLSKIAGLSGLAGLIITDPAPAGYASSAPDSGVIGGGLPDIVLRARYEMGYTPEMRLAFLRREGVDPIDLLFPHADVKADLRQPFFPDLAARGNYELYRYDDPTIRPVKDFETKTAKWSAFRAAENRRALTALHTAIRQAGPALPLYIAAIPPGNGDAREEPTISPLYRPWGKPDMLPVWSNPSSGPAAKDDSSFNPMRFWGPGGGAIAPRFLALALKDAANPPKQAPTAPATFALDLSPLSTADAIKLLREQVKSR